MKEDLSICLLQCDLHWQDSRKNRIQIQEYLKQVNGADIIVLPEMFNTGFSVRAIHLSETMEGETLAWMKSISRKKNAVLCGSIMVKDGDAVYNRFLWAEPTGRVLHYDKRHLFNLIGEGEYFTAGTERLIIDYQGWKICPLICYDLRFPIFSRNDVDYDLLLYVANSGLISFATSACVFATSKELSHASFGFTLSIGNNSYAFTRNQTNRVF